MRDGERSTGATGADRYFAALTRAKSRALWLFSVPQPLEFVGFLSISHRQE
jgi:hypothetical protein